MSARRVTGVIGTGLLGLALTAATILIAVNALRHYRAIQAWNNVGRPYGAPTPGAREALGGERRSIFMDIDCQMWNLYAREIAEGRTLRVRRTAFDNHPYGREVHWSSGYAWLLAAAGHLRRLLSGEDLHTALERSSLLVNPILNALLVAAAGLAAAGRLGWPAGAILALAVAGSGTIMQAFHAGGPDHHGLIAISALGTLLCLVLGGAGFTRRPADAPAGTSGGWRFPEERQARRWFLLSGIFTGVGLWVSAISTTLLLAAIGVSAAGSLLFSKGAESDPEVRYAPGLWVAWGSTGAAAGFALFLLEYFPGNMSLRLEVNNPLYHLGLLGGSWLLALLCRARFLGESLRDAPRWKIVAALAALAPIPVLLLFGGERFYALRNPQLWRWHENIFEFVRIPPAEFLRQYGAPGAVWLLAATLLFRSGLRREVRAWLAFALGVALLPCGLSLWQQRWASLLAVALALAPMAGVAAASVVSAGSRGFAGNWRRFALGALVVAQFGTFAVSQLSRAASLERTGDLKLSMFAAAREAAEYIRMFEKGRQVVLLSTPWPTVAMCYAGDFRGIGSLYWENAAGLAAVTDILTATSEAEALRLIRERGITYVAFLRSDFNLSAYFYKKHGRPGSAREIEGMFGSVFTTGDYPRWIRRIPFRSSVRQFEANPDFFGVALFRVDPEVHGAAGGEP
jgi:hypothetical protein